MARITLPIKIRIKTYEEIAHINLKEDLGMKDIIKRGLVEHTEIYENPRVDEECPTTLYTRDYNVPIEFCDIVKEGE